MLARAIAAIAAVLIATLVSCTLLTNTAGFTGGEALTDAAPTDAHEGDADAGNVPVEAIARSCRGVKEKVPTASTGMYPLLDRDGGFYCDMDSFDGGWTLVRPDMVHDGKTQDIDPASKSPVDVFAGTDNHGGVTRVVTVLANDCNQTTSTPALHWMLVDELDEWRQIMATYTFRGYGNCWTLFTAIDSIPNVPNVNVYNFDLAVDLIDRQQNMGRTTTGASIPYDGVRGYCGPGPENFWHGDYEAVPRTARVVLRRRLYDEPAGLIVEQGCGTPSWELREIFVR